MHGDTRGTGTVPVHVKIYRPNEHVDLLLSLIFQKQIDLPVGRSTCSRLSYFPRLQIKSRSLSF